MNFLMTLTPRKKKIEWEYKGDYRYKIIATGGDSDRFGVCELCREYAVEVYMQTEEVQSSIHPNHYVREHCRSGIGHQSCLVLSRRAVQ